MVVRARRWLDGVAIDVADDGPGMSEALAAQVFEPFFTTKPEGEGTGLGLSISQGIVREHGGRIMLTTEEEQGSIFTVQLPLATQPPAPPDSEQRVPTRRLRVLVVDDEPHILHYMRATLEAWGHIPVVASDGAEALAVAADDNFDLVISDLRMPRLSGREFYEELARRRPELAARLVFSTGDTVRGDTLAFLESLDRPYLHKPFSLAELRSLLGRWLGKAAPTSAAATAGRWKRCRSRDPRRRPRRVRPGVARRAASGVAARPGAAACRSRQSGGRDRRRLRARHPTAAGQRPGARGQVAVGHRPRVVLPSCARFGQAPPVHAHDAHAVTLAGLVALATGVPLVATRRVDFHLRGLGLWRRAARVIAVSSAVADVLTDDGVDPVRIQVIHSGIDLDAARQAEPHGLRQQLGLGPEIQLACTVGALVPHKDHATLLHAARLLAGPFPTLHWAIAGEGELRPVLEWLAAELGIADRVHFLGHVSQPLGVIADADVYVMSSRQGASAPRFWTPWPVASPLHPPRRAGCPRCCMKGAGFWCPHAVPMRSQERFGDSVIRICASGW